MDENYVKDMRGWRLNVGDRVNIPDPNVCNDDVRKLAEKYGNKWLYCGTVELHGGLCGGVIVPLGQEQHDVVYVVADEHKQFYGLEIDREAQQREKQETVTQFLRTATMTALVNAYDGRWE